MKRIDPIRGTRRVPALAGLALVPLLLVGCASGFGFGNAARDEAARDAPDLELVAADLVYALSQVPGLAPRRTTVRMSEPDTEFGKRVAFALVATGYGVEDTSRDDGEHYVSYTSLREAGDGGDRRSYRLALGQSTVERSYADEAGRTVPTSSMSLSGVRALARPLVLDDSLFPSAGPDIDRVVVERADEPVAPTPTPVEVAPAAPSAPAPVPAPRTLAENVLQNMYERQSSNYAAAFVDYTDVMSEVLPFGDDSVRLGEANKATVRRFVAAMRPETDILSVIGCSHGPTAVGPGIQGNALLAHGRSHRVKEELLFAGIDPQAVWDEACYAPVAYDKMPARGVVLVLKRRRG